VFFGRVQWAKADTYSLIRTRTANLRVHWVENVMPPDVYVNRMVCAAGRIKTWDGGKLWTIVDAVPLPDGGPALRKILKLLGTLTADPLEWCPDLYERKRAARP